MQDDPFITYRLYAKYDNPYLYFQCEFADFIVFDKDINRLPIMDLNQYNSSFNVRIKARRGMILIISSLNETNGDNIIPNQQLQNINQHV